MATNGNPLTDHLDLWTSALLNKSAAGRGNNGRQEAYGIKKLRELILELAVRGKLVPQDSNDEPAVELLKRTIAEKKRLIKEGQIREAKPPVFPVESPDHELPANWVWTNLFEIGEIAPRNEADDTLEASFVPMQALSEKYGVPVGHEVRTWGEIKSGFTHFREEDVALAKITPCFQNGKSAVMRGLKNEFGAGTTELHVYRSINRCTAPEYVLIYLKSPRFIGDGIPNMTGTAGQKRITRDYFAGNHFPLPPLAEQHRIVAKVDELMALCDRLEQQQAGSLEAHQTLAETLLGTLTQTPVRAEPVEARPSTSSGRTEFEEAWTRIADHFDTLFTTEHSINQLKQTILQLAVMGKLVPQDPNDEPASVFLDRARVELQCLINERQIRQVDEAELSEPLITFSLPVGWAWVHIRDIAVVQGGKRLPSGAALLETPTPHIYIRVTDMKNGTIEKNGLMYISPEVHRRISRYTINKEDLYITIAGTIGDVGIVPDFVDGHNLTENAAKIVFRILDKRFFCLVLSSEFVQAQFLEKTKQMAQPKLALKRIAGAKISLPP